MTNGQRAVTTMLAVVAVLLGLNLIVGGLRPAVAQEPEIRIFPEPPVPEPTVVSVSVAGFGDFRGYRIFRSWSDGLVDITVVGFGVSEPCTFTNPCGPVVVIPGL